MSGRRKHVWHAGRWVDVTDLRHMATGEVFDSKSAFRRATREAGCVELGNDVPLARPQVESVGVAEDIATAYQQLEQGMPFVPETADGFTAENTRIY